MRRQLTAGPAPSGAGGVVEVDQSVAVARTSRGGLRLSLPQHRCVGTHQGEDLADRVTVADRSYRSTPRTSALGGNPHRRRRDQRQRDRDRGRFVSSAEERTRVGQRPMGQEGTPPGRLGITEAAVTTCRAGESPRRAPEASTALLPGQLVRHWTTTDHVPRALAQRPRWTTAKSRLLSEECTAGRRRRRWAADRVDSASTTILPLHIVSGKIVVEAEFDTGAAARRLRTNLAEIFGQQADFAVVHKGGLRKGTRYMVRVVSGGEQLARQAGMVDASGRPVRGLPPHVVTAGICDAEAAWRGAFLAHGSLTEPGRSSALEITCPGPEAALALVGAARRMGIPAKSREVRGVERVVIRDGDAISQMLARMGAHCLGARVGGTPHPSRGAGDRQPTGELRRRQSAPLGPGGGGRQCPGRARLGDPRRRRPGSPRRGRASCGWITARPPWRNSVRWQTRP